MAEETLEFWKGKAGAFKLAAEIMIGLLIESRPSITDAVSLQLQLGALITQLPDKLAEVEARRTKEFDLGINDALAELSDKLRP